MQFGGIAKQFPGFMLRAAGCVRGGGGQRVTGGAHQGGVLDPGQVGVWGWGVSAAVKGCGCGGAGPEGVAGGARRNGIRDPRQVGIWGSWSGGGDGKGLNSQNEGMSGLGAAAPGVSGALVVKLLWNSSHRSSRCSQPANFCRDGAAYLLLQDELLR